MEEKSINAIWQVIPTASEQELEHLHDRLTSAWNKGEVDRDTAETLTRLIWNRSRQIEKTAKPQVKGLVTDAA